MHLTFVIRAFRNNVMYINNLNIFRESKDYEKNSYSSFINDFAR